MNTEIIRHAYNMIKERAIAVGGIEKDARLVEISDFGDSYGFLFEIKDKQANLYWCVDKETYEPFTFRPNMDIEKYIGRKIMTADIVG